ncbi:helix-turn-helix domain-containing protein [Desulfotalea psychrophila]|uniref:HTH cro/C1-type domain-containing protein n=1 Tax=Desulfotalea psychrophila (strain LSv54 / DSM 12343) TaxID=177439 RepID=Q6AID7_DESPS|nr:helix-turn-helix transcriptional regulator [Desulfotalea psychrophila]CAG37910.1 conserved hypothetical protein [Desulfotalea psychrophila LSv54]
MRPSIKNFKKKALKKEEVKAEYERLAPVYALRKQLIKLRKDAGFTQEELAELLGTKKSNISRLENVDSKISPKISTIEKYVEKLGYRLDFTISPR